MDRTTGTARANGGLRRCPQCGRATPGFPNFFEHVEVIQGPGGATSTRSEDRLEYLCGWCGSRLEAARSVVIEDVAPL